jgi:hypothetical protein
MTARAAILTAGLPLASALAAGPGSADEVERLLDQARAACADFEQGKFDVGDAVSPVDLDGDGTPDRVIDESRFACSSSASMYCGSGGCMLHAVIGARSWSFQAEGWQVIEWAGRPILLVARDGGWCGGAGAQLCFEAVTWSGGEMLSVMPPPG